MLTLYDNATLQDTLARFDQLGPDSTRRWGKMAPAQMLAHCSAALELATGDRQPSRMLIGRLIGWLFKDSLTNDKPFNRNGPTDPTFVVSDERDFAKEKVRLVGLIQKFAALGPEGAPTHPHSFFGHLTPTQWGGSVAKHLDHHLQQFGV
ncbi:MAG: hypothetical protein JWR44_1219 [Hymenobacter sp.]|jgi:hypothetical protein|nr:hypothetical protein [Hymenobacter sp.]